MFVAKTINLDLDAGRSRSTCRGQGKNERRSDLYRWSRRCGSFEFQSIGSAGLQVRAGTTFLDWRRETCPAQLTTQRFPTDDCFQDHPCAYIAISRSRNSFFVSRAPLVCCDCCEVTTPDGTRTARSEGPVGLSDCCPGLPIVDCFRISLRRPHIVQLVGLFPIHHATVW